MQSQILILSCHWIEAADCSLAVVDSLGCTQPVQAGLLWIWLQSLRWAFAAATGIIGIHADICQSASVWGSKVRSKTLNQAQ